MLRLIKSLYQPLWLPYISFFARKRIFSKWHKNQTTDFYGLCTCRVIMNTTQIICLSLRNISNNYKNMRTCKHLIILNSTRTYGGHGPLLYNERNWKSLNVKGGVHSLIFNLDHAFSNDSSLEWWMCSMSIKYDQELRFDGEFWQRTSPFKQLGPNLVWWQN